MPRYEKRSRKDGRNFRSNQGGARVTVKVEDQESRKKLAQLASAVENLSKMVTQENKRQQEQNEQGRKKDMSMTSMDEMERMFDAMTMEADDQYYAHQTEDIREHTINKVYTTAWSHQPIADYALALAQSVAVSERMEASAFCAWVCALAEDYVASQDCIIGVAGNTRATVNAARDRLSNVEIPEHVGLLFLMLRPRRVESSNTTMILLPHAVEDHNNAAIAAQPQFNQGLANNAVDIFFADPVFYTQRGIGAVGGPHALNNVTRTNVITACYNAYRNSTGARIVHANTVQAALRLTCIGFRDYGERDLCLAISHNANNLQYREVWYDVMYNINYSPKFTKDFGRTWTYFGSCENHFTTMVVPCIGCRIYDANSNTFTHIAATRTKDAVIPWFETDTWNHFLAIIAAIQAQVVRYIPNNLEPEEIKGREVTVNAWHTALKSMCRGDPSKVSLIVKF